MYFCCRMTVCVQFSSSRCCLVGLWSVNVDFSENIPLFFFLNLFLMILEHLIICCEAQLFRFHN